MAIYKRWKGQKINAEHPHWKDARWTVEFVLHSRRIIQSVPEARTQSQAERAENKLREDIYNRRYGNAKNVGLTMFFTETYLPWVKSHRAESSYRDAVSRGQELTKFFGDQPIAEITVRDCERFKTHLAKVETVRGSKRAGATVNRYLALLSGMCSRAIEEELLSANPCSKIEDEEEQSRARYLTPDEYSRLTQVLNGDLEYLKAPLLVSLNTGLRKYIELLQLKVKHLNFSSRPVFFPIKGGSIEVPPNWLIVVRGKGSKPRLIPMNSIVRALLLEAVEERRPEEFVFNKNANAVNDYSLRWGFVEACEKAEIVAGASEPGGIIWHDLRRTFATRLRANGVHEYDIQDLLGHSNTTVTRVYARATMAVLEQAVEKLTEPWGQVVEFERRVG